VRERDRYVNVELKSLPWQDPELGRVVLGLVRRLEIGDRVLFSSFDHELVRALKGAEPRVAAAVLASDRLVDPARYVTEVIGADAFHPCVTPKDDTLGLVRSPAHGPGLLADRVGALRRAGLMVNVWTVNDPTLVPYLKEAGVTGIITDFPARISKAAKRGRR
jgi:glycerophosphoryl diester phosphodiesterase